MRPRPITTRSCRPLPRPTVTEPPLDPSDAKGPPSGDGSRDADREATAKIMNDFLELNRDRLTREAFAGMIVAVLRSALSQHAQSSGTREIHEFVDRPSSIHFCQSAWSIFAVPPDARGMTTIG